MVDSRPIPLRWYCHESQKYFTAGIGFYNGTYGDYTLKLNLNRGRLNLKPVSFENEKTQFRVEELKQENGKSIKDMVGIGEMDETTRGKIHIKLGGYSDLLILG